MCDCDCVSRSDVEEMLAERDEQIAALESECEQLRDERDTALTRIDELEETVERNSDEIEDTRDEIENQPTIEFRGDSRQLNDLWIGSHPVGTMLDNNNTSIKENTSRIVDLERGEVDVDDVLDHEGTENQLPIQRDNAARKSDAPADLSANQERATYVWAAFHERAVPGHGKLRMEFSTARRILELNDFDTNPNTVRRTMEFVAKGTSRNDNRRPEVDENLITLRHGESCNSLVADQDEWESFFAEQMEHAAGMSDDAQDNAESDEGKEATTGGDAAADDMDAEMAVLSSASAVTSDENDSVDGEITVS